MSITRIVEGDLINTSTAMNLTANAGDYEFSTPMKNQWKGETEGVVESDYKASNKEDTLSNSINVNLNLFFDGTQNNKTNTEARLNNSEEYNSESNKKDDSYQNDFTNVARGFDALNSATANQVAVYIEGIGTEDLKDDTVFPGVATGQGGTGVPAKVAKGCKEAAKSISAKFSGKEIDYLYVNVYGFSRGAAAARYFIHVASTQANYIFQRNEGDKKNYFIKGEYQPQFKLTLKDTSFIDQYGYFGACLLEKQLKVKKIIFNFVGIYDTVASYGIAHYNDVDDLDLDSVKKARYVFHLVSDDEYRENFDLTNIKSAGLCGLELTLPGVHSDIGGSYRNHVVEESVICHGVGDSARKKATEFKEILINEGWYNDDQLKIIEKRFDNGADQYNYLLKGTRMLENAYDKIPLDLMVEKSKNFKVEYLEYLLEPNKIKDPFINQIYNQIKGYYNAMINIRNRYVEEYNKESHNFDSYSKNYLNEIKPIHYSTYINENDLHQLRNKYLHWSVKSNQFGLSARISDAVPQHKRKREIHHG